MAVRQVLVNADLDTVWSVLADGQAYPRWVVETQEIRAEDASWPEVGSSIYFTAGLGPFVLKGDTTVRVLEWGRRLELEAHALPYGTARVAIQTIPWTDRTTVVILDEHPLRGTGARLHNRFVDSLLHLRTRRMLSNLARVAEERASTG